MTDTNRITNEVCDRHGMDPFFDHSHEEPAKPIYEVRQTYVDTDGTIRTGRDYQPPEPEPVNRWNPISVAILLFAGEGIIYTLWKLAYWIWRVL